MIKTRVLQFLGLVCYFFQGYAQFQANYWYFGNFNGIHFTNGYAAPLTHGQLKSPEGCATISDSLGNLLFYTDGKNLYGKHHQLISNQLVGNPDAAQSSLFIPYPSHEDTLFLFVNGAYGSGGLHYYLLSASAQTILSGPSLLYQPTCEKVTAVHQNNHKDFWLLTHEWNSDKFICYAITSSGISNPVTTHIGTIHTGTSVIASGTMKFSLQGDQVACAIPYLNLVESFDFQNGVLSNPRQKSLQNPYGVSFSPNGQFLYVTGYFFGIGGILTNEIYQWSTTNQWNLVGSWSCPLFTPEIWIGDITNAPDGKMYIAQKDAQALAVIEKPNLYGTACNFLVNGLPTPNYVVQYGLPNFVQSYLTKPPLNFELPTSVCATDSFVLCANSNLQGNFEWTIQNQVFSTARSCLKYAFAQPGEYFIQLKQQGYQVTKKIKVYAKPQNPFPQTLLYACKGEMVTLNALNSGASYFWSNGLSAPSITIDRSGNYNVKIFFGEGYCAEIFPIQVIFVDTPKYDFRDTILCGQSFITYINPFMDAQALWDNNLSADTFTITQNGTYIVKWIRSGTCVWEDTFQVKISAPKQRYMPLDTTFCSVRESILLDAGPAETYLWNTNETTRTIITPKPDNYTVIKTDVNGCSTTEEIIVKNECNLLFMPNAFTPNQDGKNETLKPIAIEPLEYELFIYNEAGKLLYQGLEWDGNNAPEGVYVVLVKGKWSNGNSLDAVYNVTLIR